jgi:hypothetical protein
MLVSQMLSFQLRIPYSMTFIHYRWNYVVAQLSTQQITNYVVKIPSYVCKYLHFERCFRYKLYVQILFVFNASYKMFVP